MADLRARSRLTVLRVSSIALAIAALSGIPAASGAVQERETTSPNVRVSASGAAASQGLSTADSALVAGVLLAEDRRDTAATVYAEALRSPDARIRALAARAIARVRDPRFAARDSVMGTLPAPPAYDDPAWRLRYRQLGNRNDDCGQLARAMHDPAWAVRLRAADLVTGGCAGDTAVTNTLRTWTATLTPNSVRAVGNVSWHPAAHALVALARTAPADARPAVQRFAASAIPQVRTYTARAAALLGDTATLARLAADRDPNVVEAAVAGLGATSGHSRDAAIVPALGSTGYQAVRAAARALRGTALRTAALDAAIASAFRLRSDSSETSRDARRAVVDLIGSLAAPTDWPRIAPLTTDFDCAVAAAAAAVADSLHVSGVRPSCSPLPIALPPDALRLALGAGVRVRVTMADSSGGGSFVVRLRGDAAPIMAARVLQLVREGYYDNRPWHRVEPDFVIQGPGANEFVGSPRYVRDELSTLPHVRGTVGMSTRSHDTGDAQWFVNLRDNRRLDRDYTVFAEVVDGIGVVDGIVEGDVVARMEILPAG